MIEFVPRHATPKAPPSNAERWAAREALYRLTRNQEPNRAGQKPAKESQ